MSPDTLAPLGALRLDRVLLPPPLSTAVAVLIVAGVAFAGDRLARRCRGQACEALDRVGGIVLVTGALAALVQALALAGLAPASVLRLLGAVASAVGLLGMVSGLRVALRAGLPSRSRECWPTGRLERVGAGAAAVTALGLTLAALGPPTDADSLSYHLGVPLAWLGHGGAVPLADWYHARLTGPGEALILLGLGCGTDVLSACFQLVGLGIAAVTLTSFAEEARARQLGWLLVLACPVVTSLVPSQKPQMLPAAALALALAVVVRRYDHLDGWSLAVATGAIALGLGSRPSFLLTGAVVAAFTLGAAWRSGRLGLALVAGALAYGVLGAPVHARNVVFYGDPLSPFLETFRPGGDPAVVGFAAHLRDVAGPRSLARLVRLPVDLVGTRHPGAIGSVLGIGAAGWLAARATGSSAMLLLAASGGAAVVLALGQLAPRFFLEPYLWCGMAVVAGPWGRAKTWLLRALGLQAVVVAAVASAAAATLFPGALTPGLRDGVMRVAAYGYAEARWLDDVLPRDAVVVVDIRSRALAPRPFAVLDPVSPRLPAGEQRRRLDRIVRTRGVNALVLGLPPRPSGAGLLFPCRAGILAGPRTFTLSARNPFNRPERAREVVAFALDLADGRCLSPRPP